MLVSCWKTLSLLLALMSSCTTMAQLTHFQAPNFTVWVKQGSEMGKGNGIFLSPDGQFIVSTHLDGSVRWMDPATGDDIVAPFFPESRGFSIRGFGGVAFGNYEGNSYVAYAITDDYLGDATTRVIGLDSAGQKLFESSPLPGLQAGTPVVSSDGRYVYMNSNVDGSIGYFHIVDLTTWVDPNTPVTPTYQNFNSTAPFSPIGIYQSPERGNYVGGEFNINDMLVWNFDTPINFTESGDGQLFAFQMPSDGSPIEYFLMGGVQAFQSNLPPVLTNGGRSMYWATSRSQQSCWVDRLFNRGRTNSFGTRRGTPPFATAGAPPTLSSNPETPNVFGPSASNSIWAADYLLENQYQVDVSAPVTSRLAISPDDLYVYVATITGSVSAHSTADLNNIFWTVDLPTSFGADIALSRDGNYLFTGDTSGLIAAHEVASGLALDMSMNPTAAVIDTLAPSPGPVETETPTLAATTQTPTAGATTLVPTLAATEEATTEAPTFEVTEAQQSEAPEATDFPNATDPTDPPAVNGSGIVTMDPFPADAATDATATADPTMLGGATKSPAPTVVPLEPTSAPAEDVTRAPVSSPTPGSDAISIEFGMYSSTLVSALLVLFM